MLLAWLLFSLKVQAALLLEEPIAYYGNDFYTALKQNQLTDDKLKAKLRDILRLPHLIQKKAYDQIRQSCPAKAKAKCYQHEFHTYRSARRFMYGELHLEDYPKGGYQIKTFYCSKALTRADFPKGRAPGPGKNLTGKVTNTEHLWPQSHFNRYEPKQLQKSDVHILVPVLSQVNSSRGNHPFGEAKLPYRVPCRQVNRGYIKKNSKKIYFEPPQHHKGDVARALFYFSVRYQIAIDKIQEGFLRKWHRQDPVDQWEIYRNQTVFEFQKNRNPFIDHPSLVNKIDDF